MTDSDTMELNNGNSVNIIGDENGIFKKYMGKQSVKIIKSKVMSSNILDNLTMKYTIVLVVVNIILKNDGKMEIDDLIKFNEIDRETIIKPETEAEFEKMLPMIYKYFGKRECQFNQKGHTKHYIITVLKNMCKQISLCVTKRYKNVQVKGYVSSHVLYSIKYM